jgi:two-component system, OmpR family, sensor histidine kinase KdpD
MPRVLRSGAMQTPSPTPSMAPRHPLLNGLWVWAAAWAAMLVLDAASHGTMDLANLAMLLVLASAVSGLWLRPAVSALACTAAVLAFNWCFVPPRGAFSVDLHQHVWLLGAMMVIGWIVAALVARQRAAASRAWRVAAQAQQLQALGEALRDVDDPQSHARALQEALSAWCNGPMALLTLRAALPVRDNAESATWLGNPDADVSAGLWLATRQAAALGPGTGRHEDQPHWYLPMRARGAAYGAAQMPAQMPAHPADDGHSGDVRAHAQALCDQMGLALERRQALRSAAQAREQAQAQQLRNALLAAIAHDHRTPLATILGAASSLVEQDARLSIEQRRRLATSIIEEADRLARLTDNTLQLARLDAPGLALTLDWQSAEELVGSALARVKHHDARRHQPQQQRQQQVRTRVEPNLPLLRCDAVLIVQMLINLLDNALKYGAPDAPVELLVRHIGEEMMFAVRDRGPGVPPQQRERIFEVFKRGDVHAVSGCTGLNIGSSSGSGIGLALCRAVARVHGGRLTLRARHHGGSSFECWLPLTAPPVGAEAEPATDTFQATQEVP